MTVRELIDKLERQLPDGAYLDDYIVLVSETRLTKVRAVSIVVDQRNGRNEVTIV